MKQNFVDLKRNVREMVDDSATIAKRFKTPLKYVDRYVDKVGSKGKPIELIANHFRLALRDVVYYHFTVKIKSRFNKLKERQLSKLERIQVLEKMANDSLKLAFDDNVYAFDSKNIYTRKLIAIDGQHCIDIQFDGLPSQTLLVNIMFEEELRMSEVNAFFEGRIIDMPIKLVKALETVLLYMPMKKRFPICRSLFSSQTAQPFVNNTVLVSGHFMSPDLTEMGATLLIDKTAALFRPSGPLIDIICRAFKRKPESFKDKPFVDHNGLMITKLNRQLTGLSIYTTHTGVRERFTIKSISLVNPELQRIETRIDDNSGGKVSMSLSDYFKKKFNKDLQYRYLPCVKLKEGSYLLVETCEVYPDQPVSLFHISPYMHEEMRRQAGQQAVINRFSSIKEFAEDINQESQSLLNDFGISFNTRPVKVSARVLDTPDREGNAEKVKLGKTLIDWCFINLSPLDSQTIAKFIRRLVWEAKDMDINIVNINGTDRVLTQTLENESSVNDIFVEVMKKWPSIQMLMFCLPIVRPTKCRDMYAQIKNKGDVVYGLMTQCVHEKNITQTPSEYFPNILLKINGKLDGQNVVLSPPERPMILNGINTMIFGVDITHPDRNRQKAGAKIESSVAACVGSYDSLFSKFSASISVQPRTRLEYIVVFERMVGELLKEYQSANDNCLPDTVIIYRAGVSSGQLGLVLRQECNQFAYAWSTLTTKPMPKITFIALQTGHRNRFVPMREQEAIGLAGNIPAGTVVDTGITNPVLFEYYLCSHEAVKGTSCPSKYIVLRDDNYLTADQMQELTYSLCFTYSSTTKSVSVPAPVKYAHLAAHRSKLHIIQQSLDKIDGLESESRAQRGSCGGYA